MPDSSKPVIEAGWNKIIEHYNPSVHGFILSPREVRRLLVSEMPESSKG
jgi:hypothetical protein